MLYSEKELHVLCLIFGVEESESRISPFVNLTLYKRFDRRWAWKTIRRLLWRNINSKLHINNEECGIGLSDRARCVSG
ncbi:MAG: hypothetical protein RR356_07075 [Bacteroidales bacterium]